HYSLTLNCLTSFFFHVTPPTDFSPLSLHDALPICYASNLVWRTFPGRAQVFLHAESGRARGFPGDVSRDPPAGRSKTEMASNAEDRKSTRLNSSHDQISYAVFCLKKKKNTNNNKT